MMRAVMGVCARLAAVTAVMLSPVLPAAAQDEPKLSAARGVEWSVEMQSSVTFGGGRTPLWLNANKYGLSSTAGSNGYMRVAAERPLATDDDFRWGVGYGIDVAAAYNYTSSVIVQQAYVEGRWLKGVLTVGSKHQPMELKNGELSSGPQTLGINARPVPQVRIALPDYWDIPGTKGWLGVKGHIAYGMTTDDGWQRDFTQRRSRYTENAMYHSKAGYLRIGNEYRFVPVALEVGLEMAALYGGTSYNVGEIGTVVNQGGLKGAWQAFIPGGSEPRQDVYRNVGGDQLGSWVARLSLDYENWYLGVYWDHFFEDHSAMFHLDYDGYGTGDEWNVRKDNRYRLYALKDMLAGAELRLKRGTWINCIVAEYIYTKYQSGPIYHDHTPSMPDHIGGIDSYYNHHIYTGWQHWGQVMGNPLYMSPIYNDDGKIEVKNNRFYAFHLGVSGDPGRRLHYRLLATYQKGWGTYKMPYPDPREGLSVMGEAQYTFSHDTPLGGWSIKASAGVDAGRLRGNSQGAQLTVRRQF